MKRLRSHFQIIRQAVLSIGLASFFAISTPNAHADVSFLGVAAGDATSTSAILWTRAVDTATPANTSLTLEYSPTPLPPVVSRGPILPGGLTRLGGACTTDSTKDYVCKLKVDGLAPNTVYFYRFVGPASEASNIGKFKTAPDWSEPQK